MSDGRSLAEQDRATLFFDRLRAEVVKNEAQYGDFNSMHEGLGVLLEEFQELTEAVRLKPYGCIGGPKLSTGRQKRIENEALQVAAVALAMSMQAQRVTR